MNTTLPKTRWQEIKDMWTHEYTALWVLPGVLLGFAFGFFIRGEPFIAGITDFLVNLMPELFGIGLAVTILYRYEQRRDDRRDEKQLKEELLWQIHSRSNDVAISAIDRLRANGWLDLFKKRDLAYVKWSEANLENCDLSGANMVWADLPASNLEGANLFLATLDTANLKKARLISANLSHAQVFDADMSEAYLQDATLIKTSLAGTNLSNVYLESANLDHANLRHTDLSGADMVRTNLKNSELHNANLGGANLWNANLEGAELQATHFDEQTILPDGIQWTSETDMNRFTDPNHPNFWRSDDELSPAY